MHTLPCPFQKRTLRHKRLGHGVGKRWSAGGPRSAPYPGEGSPRLASRPGSHRWVSASDGPFRPPPAPKASKEEHEAGREGLAGRRGRDESKHSSMRREEGAEGRGSSPGAVERAAGERRGQESGAPGA